MVPRTHAASSNGKLEVDQSYTSFISFVVPFFHPNRDVRIFRQECHSIRLYSNATLLTKSPSLSKRKHHALSVGVMPPEPGLTSHPPASPAPFIYAHVPTTTARHFHYQIRSRPPSCDNSTTACSVDAHGDHDRPQLSRATVKTDNYIRTGRYRGRVWFTTAISLPSPESATEKLYADTGLSLDFPTTGPRFTSRDDSLSSLSQS